MPWLEQNQQEDEANSHPSWVREGYDHDHTQIINFRDHATRARVYALDYLGRQAGPHRVDHRDEKIADLARTVQTLIERLDSNPTKVAEDRFTDRPGFTMGTHGHINQDSKEDLCDIPRSL